jgi:hypothetical protein
VAAARKNNIGTIQEFEFPEGSLKIIDLVEIARSLGLQTMQSCEDEYVMDEEEECDEEVEEEFFESDANTNAREEETTLDHSCSAVRQNDCESGVSDAAPCETKPTIIDCVLRSETGAPCQLVALATPPSALGGHPIYVALSDALFSFTAPKAPTAGVDAATAKIVVAATKARSGPVGSCCSTNADGATKASSHAVVAGGLPGKSPYRFRFNSEHLQELGAGGFVQSKLSKSSKLHKADDGSRWVVDDTFASAPRWFTSLGQQRYQGAAVTEFTSEGKVKLDAGAVVALPKIPGRLPSQEQGSMRMCLSAVRSSHSAF